MPMYMDRHDLPAGEPVTASERLFGPVIQLAARTCAAPTAGRSSCRA